MKTLLRAITFSFIALQAGQYVIKAFDFGLNPVPTFLLIWISLTVLYFFIKPILKIALLPTAGLGYIFMLFVLTFAVLYVLTLFIPAFSIMPTSLSGLIIFGFMLPSKDLTSLWAGVFSAFVISVVYSYLQSLCGKK